jgi:KDO2-lipid IV(A) lauroyltransferase
VKQRIHIKKFLEIHVGSLFFKLYFHWVKRLSIDSLESWGEKLGSVAFYILRRRKKIALQNMLLAFGKEKDKGEFKQIYRANLKNIGMNMMEVARCVDFKNGYLKNLVTLEGKEYLDNALAQKKGVICLTAHIGNFPLMCTRLVKEGYPVSLVARNPENPEITAALASIMKTIGMEAIPDKPRRTCVSRSLKALKKNRVLLLQIDQNAPRTESWVDFFGYLVPTFNGPVVLSLRTGAPILPMFIIRNSTHLHTASIYPPFELAITGDIEKDITTNIARLTKLTEAAIREHPDQWWWFHRRFRKARDIKTGKKLFPKYPSKEHKARDEGNKKLMGSIS